MIAAGRLRSRIGELLGGWVEAREFGVRADGATDDAAALQAAIDAAPAGGVVALPQGDIRLGSTVQLKPDVTLRGVGNLSRLTTTDATLTLLRAAGPNMDNVRVIDVGFSHPAAATGYSIDLDNCIDSWLVRCYGYQFRISGSNTIRVQDCVADGGGFDLTSTFNSHFVGCLAYNRRRTLSGWVLTTVQDCSFSACISSQAEKHGFELIGSDRNTFTGCVAENPSYLAAGTYSGVYIDATSDRNSWLAGRSANHVPNDPATYEAHGKYALEIIAGAADNHFVAADFGQAATNSVQDAGTRTTFECCTASVFANPGLYVNAGSPNVWESWRVTATGWVTGANATIAGYVNIGGNLDHDGAGAGFFGTAPAAKPTVIGSRGGNAALASLLTALATLGLVTDSSTA